MGNKIGMVVVSVIIFAILFFTMDHFLQSWQGLELFPSGESH